MIHPNIQIPADLPQQVERALAEDIGAGDLTAALIAPGRQGRASIITREAAIMCGSPYVRATFEHLDPCVEIAWHAAEGAAVVAGQRLFTLSGPSRALLTGERTALNFMQLLSATATAANHYVQLIAHTECRLLDTRKTIPGLRTAQKYAVRVGGGTNHRMGLFDGVLIKENHIMAAGSIALAVEAARLNSQATPVEVEVENLEQLRQAIAAGADTAMLDNFSLTLMREAVALNAAAATPLRLEASGGIDEATIRSIAETGVDFISVGSITKNVRAIDLSMRFDWKS